jgi:hypothetical protein
VKKDDVTLENKGFEIKIGVSDLTLPKSKWGWKYEKSIKLSNNRI